MVSCLMLCKPKMTYSPVAIQTARLLVIFTFGNIFSVPRWSTGNWARCSSVGGFTQNVMIYYHNDKLWLSWLAKLSFQLTNICVIHGTIPTGSKISLSLLITVQIFSELGSHEVQEKGESFPLCCCWNNSSSSTLWRKAEGGGRDMSDSNTSFPCCIIHCHVPCIPELKRIRWQSQSVEGWIM